MSRIRLVSVLLLPPVCVVVRSAEQFRLQCTLDSLQWRQWRDRKCKMIICDVIAKDVNIIRDKTSEMRSSTWSAVVCSETCHPCLVLPVCIHYNQCI